MKNVYLLFGIFFIFFLVTSINCSSGTSSITEPILQDLPITETDQDGYSVLLSGRMNLETGDLIPLERSLENYLNVTSIVGSNFSFSINGVLPDNVLDITLTLNNATDLTVYDVLIVFKDLYSKEVVNPDSYIDIFNPGVPMPFIAFRKDDPSRAFPPGIDEQQLRLKVPPGAPALVEFFIIAHLGTNTGGIYEISDFEKQGYLTTHSNITATLRIKALDHQNDITSITADTSAITGDITTFSPTSDPQIWEAIISNNVSAPVGNYPIMIEATSPSSPQYKTYQYYSIDVDFDLTPLDSLMQNASFSSVVILKLGGELIYEKAFGSISLNQRAQLVSGNKWVTAALVMKLASDGVLDIDNTVASYLPDWGGTSDERKQNITIRQCLSHISGIRTSNSCLDNPDMAMGDCAYAIGDASLLSAPGSRFYYGQSSFQVAAYVCEYLTGVPYAQLVEQELTAPLGMDSYGFTETPGEYVSNPHVGATGYCTAHDYAKMLQMLLDGGVHNGERLISEENVADMFTNQTRGVPIWWTPYLFTRYWGIEYNLGNWREEVHPDTDELWVSGSQGILGFSPWIDFRKDLVGVLLCESFFTSVFPVYIDLKDTVDSIIPDKQN